MKTITTRIRRFKPHTTGGRIGLGLMAVLTVVAILSLVVVAMAKHVQRDPVPGRQEGSDSL